MSRMAQRNIPLAPWCGTTCGTVGTEGPGSTRAKACQRLWIRKDLPLLLRQGIIKSSLHAAQEEPPSLPNHKSG